MWVVWNTALAKLNCVMMVRFFFQSKKCVSNLALISFYGSVRNLLSLVFFLTWGNLLVLNIFYHLSILFSICGVCWQIETICTKVISSLLFHLTLGASSLSLLKPSSKMMRAKKIAAKSFNSTMTNENCN